MGEELGWLVSPFLNGCYFGHLATGDTQWVERLVDWTDACIRRAIKEPDGFTGWPKSGTGGLIEAALYTDSLLGEAMLLRPVVLMADRILKTPALAEKWSGQARSYLKLAEETFQKWDSRACWREVKDGGVWVRLMKSRMKTRADGKYFVWNYWDPAGPWDYKPDGLTRHWVGVHPNGGYYAIDVEAI